MQESSDIKQASITTKLSNADMRFGTGQKWAFGLGSFSQWFINGAFTTWVFSFYFAAIGLPVYLITIAYIIWAISNAFTNPIVGFISDRTRTRFGRRKPYIMIGTVPVLVIEILLWIPPAGVMGEFVYLLVMLLCYDVFYTMISLPFDSLFPELYTSVNERAQVNMIKQIMAIVGLLCAFLIPGSLIGQITIRHGYVINGIVTSIIVGATLLISLKYGVTERKEFKLDYKQEFGFVQSLKYTVRNRGFVLYTIMYFLYEYVLLVLSTTVPLFTTFVLGQSAFMASIMLGLLFIVGLATVAIWRKLDVKLGSRKAYGISIIVYIVVSVPMLFVSAYLQALITAAIMGFGFGGMLYFIYLLIADVIDDDELKTGIRREGAFFGVTNFFMRLAMVLSITTVSLVFATNGWEVINPSTVTPGLILGLHMLVVVFPGLALGISLLCLYFYPFTKKKVAENKERMKVLHEEKLGKVQASEL